MLPELTGATRIHLIVGDPIAQTKSPAGLTRVSSSKWSISESSKKRGWVDC